MRIPAARVVSGAVVTLAVAGCVATGAASADSPSAPSVVSSRPSDSPVVALREARSTSVITYSSTAVDGEPTVMTGSLLLPRSAPGARGWPLVVWNHMTVGAADRCAPSRAVSGDPELAHMTSGDDIVRALLRAGFAVVRPDYEGIGGPGQHPYLIMKSLRRSVIDAARAVHSADRRIGADVVMAGHSEGAVAALAAGAAPTSEWGDLHLRGVAAVAPPTHMGEIVSGVSQLPLSGNGIADLTGLAALMVSGAAATDPAFATLVRSGGLSPAAMRIFGDVDRKCYVQLTRPDSFGGLSPAQLLGPRGQETAGRLAAIADRNDVRRLRLSDRIPVRIDAGAYDAVAPLPLVSDLADTYRAQGVPVTFAIQPAAHSAVPTTGRAAADIAAWITHTMR